MSKVRLIFAGASTVSFGICLTREFVESVRKHSKLFERKALGTDLRIQTELGKDRIYLALRNAQKGQRVAKHFAALAKSGFDQLAHEMQIFAGDCRLLARNQAHDC